MYKLDTRIKLEVRFVKHGEYDEKIYEDKFGNTLVWFNKSDKIKETSWVNISAKVYSSLNPNGDIKHYTLFNPRIIK